MPPPLDIDREQVKMLVLAVGCTEAAKQTGIALNTILQWSARGKWLKPEKPKLPPTMTPTPVIGVIKPVQALESVLADDERETRISLSKAARNLAKQSESADLSQAGDALQAGKLAALTHRWSERGDPGTPLTFFNVNGNMSVSVEQKTVNVEQA